MCPWDAYMELQPPRSTQWGVPFTMTNEGNMPFVDLFFQVIYKK